ncbi:hypothetical protein PgNI_05816 [Pyricularia grisea]|uniref:Uncharacterized protein n=1 Tax=Pyricularia grisea TaxID=148305 RepID=A0A6P8B6B1_PYRGI|nr:hypothetical protein PgNI_05816 [Pyricularia grisea]TLD10659.1 hypothetical protein PgNI_05816 [Pyricularia grisea]
MFGSNHIGSKKHCRLTAEVVRLTLHGTKAAHLPVEPVLDLVVLSGTVGVRHLVLRVITVHEVLHDGGALKQVDGLAIGKSVGQCWDATVGVDVKKPLLLLHVLHDVDLGHLVLKAQLLKQDRHLDAIGRTSGVQVNVGFDTHVGRLLTSACCSCFGFDKRVVRVLSLRLRTDGVGSGSCQL